MHERHSPVLCLTFRSRIRFRRFRVGFSDCYQLVAIRPRRDEGVDHTPGAFLRQLFPESRGAAVVRVPVNLDGDIRIGLEPDRQLYDLGAFTGGEIGFPTLEFHH